MIFEYTVPSMRVGDEPDASVAEPHVAAAGCGADWRTGSCPSIVRFCPPLMFSNVPTLLAILPAEPVQVSAGGRAETAGAVQLAVPAARRAADRSSR